MKETILNSLFFATARVAKALFIRQTQRTEAVQKAFLTRFLNDFQNTALGSDLGLSKIKDIETFRSHIPVLPYRHYEPYFQRIGKGEQGVLTPDPVLFLTVSSGTTGKRKLTPVTRQSYHIRNHARRASTGFFGLAMKRRGLKVKRFLLTNTSHLIEYTESGIPCGAASAIDLTFNQKAYRGRNLFPYPFEILTIPDSTTRHYLCLMFTLARHDLGVVTGNFPANVLTTASLIDKYRDDFIKDIEHGTIADWLELPDTLRIQLKSRWQANPIRAWQLRELIETTGTLRPKGVWPDMTTIITARGTPSHYYFRKFPDYFGNTPVFGGIYGSSEAIYGVYHDFDSDEAVLPVDIAFYEFVPESEWDQEFPKTLLAHEVETGSLYRVLVTNYSGLYRYDIGDVVKVLGRYHGAPTLTFIRRKGGQLSSTSEKTTEWHADQTIMALQDQFKIRLEDYCITLSEDREPPAYLVNIELKADQNLSDPVRFITQFDHQLKEIHEMYRHKRNELVPPPRLRLLKPGSFAELRARSTSTPGADTNFKFLHITEDRRYLDGLTVSQEVYAKSSS